MTVFLMTIRETLPPTEKTPLISELLSLKVIKFQLVYFRSEFFFSGLFRICSFQEIKFRS